MDKDLDLKIKEILKENDDIIVPDNISNGIDDTLNQIRKENKKRYSTKKIAMVASVAIVVAISPIGVKATINNVYKYIPGRGNIINAENSIYVLTKPITKKVDNKNISIIDVQYNLDEQLISVSVEGIGKQPKDISTLTINNKKIKSEYSSGYRLDNSGSRSKWYYDYYFKYNKKYNGKDLVFSLILDDNSEIEYSFKLEEAKGVKDYKELGVTSSNHGIDITTVVDEDNNTLNVNFLNNIELYDTNITYGVSPYPSGWYLDNENEGIITLTDANNKIIKGEFIEHYVNYRENNFSFDIEGLKKPFIINIPYINVNTSGVINSSNIIDIPIPKDGEEIYINKEVKLEDINDKDVFKDANCIVNIVKGSRQGDEYSLYIRNIYNEEKYFNTEWIKIRPAGNSIPKSGEEWFEGGVSGYRENDFDGEILTFKLPYPESDELSIKITDNQSKVEGPWEITIE